MRSYRDLPLILYQIQTKFRDERRPRFGLMRGREFIMKDAYSFDVDEDALDESYQKMYDAYCRIFERCGLNFRAVEADTGAIGGSCSHEFMVLADTGEDKIAVCTACDYAANVELAPCKRQNDKIDEKEKELKLIPTPGKKTIEEVSSFLGVSNKELIKTLIIKTDDKVIAALIRGDHELNDVKLTHVLGVDGVELADEETVKKVTGAPVGFAGPIGLDESIEVIADYSTFNMKNFVVGANKQEHHYINCNWERDIPRNRVRFADIRIITEEDTCPKCGSKIEIKRGIEVGHVFKLGTKYSEALGATYLDSNGKERPIIMGCYGIGIGRSVAASIEQNHDENGIIFPVTIAPFEVIISLLNPKDIELKDVAEKIYVNLQEEGIEVLLDDRDVRPGVKFKDADLIGIPLRITIGKRFKDKGLVELYERKSGNMKDISLDDVIYKVRDKIKSLK